MRVGAENRTKLVLACVLFVIAVAMAVRMVISGGPQAVTATAAAAAQPATEAAPTLAPRSRRGARLANPAPAASTVTLDPRLRLDLLRQSEETEYKGAGRNIFRAEAEPVIPKPVASAIKNSAPPVPQGPPPPPPINLKFFGFANSPGEPARVFLAQGDDVFIAGEGDIVNRRYKIVHIGPNSVELQDVLSNNRQTIPLTQG